MFLEGSVYLERDNDTDRLQNSVYIYTFVFTGIYTGLFCHNPVESRLIPLEFGGIQRNGCIPAGICGASKSTAWMAYGRHHSIGIPYGFHSGHGIKKWLCCQPKNGPCPVHGIRLESTHSIWNPYGK